MVLIRRILLTGKKSLFKKIRLSTKYEYLFDKNNVQLKKKFVITPTPQYSNIPNLIKMGSSHDGLPSFWL